MRVRPPNTSMPFSVHSVYRQMFKLWRQRRFELFLRLMKPGPSDVLLDVGGYPGFWTLHPQILEADSIASIFMKCPGIAKMLPTTTSGQCLAMAVPSACPTRVTQSRFPNSVIEHVGSWECQQQFAVQFAAWEERYGCRLLHTSALSSHTTWRLSFTIFRVHFRATPCDGARCGDGLSAQVATALIQWWGPRVCCVSSR